MKYMSESIISRSTKSRTVGRASMTVTLMLSAEIIEAYSRPITPAPTTMRSRGSESPFRSWSESMIRFPSSGTVSLCAGRVPQAIRMCSPRTRVAPSRDSISSVLPSTNFAVPESVVTRLRLSWARTTSISRASTFCTRKARSATVMSFETV